MSDLKKYIEKRKKTDGKFALEYESGYENFKIGALLKIAREEAGLTQTELAQKMDTQKTAISRIENHAEDIRLSKLEKYARELGKHLYLKIA